MSKMFCLGVLLAGLGVCIGCGESTDSAPGESPAYEQEMTEGTEATTEGTEEAAPAEAAPEEAAAPEAPAAAAPAAESAAPAAPKAP